MYAAGDGRRSSVQGLLQGQFTAQALEGIGSFTSCDGTSYNGEVCTCSHCSQTPTPCWQTYSAALV